MWNLRNFADDDIVMFPKTSCGAPQANTLQYIIT